MIQNFRNKIFMDGYRARLSDVDMEDNPYKGTHLAKHWLNGYMCRKHDEKMLEELKSK